MRAKHIPRIDIHDRMELKNALPLRTPYVIYIDPCDTCNFRCKFCPSGNIELMKKTKGRGHGPMDFEVYRGIIDSLKEFPDPIRVVRLYKEGEPLVNPRFADMVRYAKRSPRVQRVDTTTNASLLTPERSLEIIDAGLDRLNISVEGVNADQYRDFSGHKMDYQQFVDNIAFFYDHKKQCEMNIKINGDILTRSQEEDFYRTFGNITDGISVERTIEYWTRYNEMNVDFDENVSLLGSKSREIQVCPYVLSTPMPPLPLPLRPETRHDPGPTCQPPRNPQEGLGQHHPVAVPGAVPAQRVQAHDRPLLPQMWHPQAKHPRRSGRIC